MPRLSPRPFLIVAFALAALLPGAALHAQDDPGACYAFDLDNLRETASDADIIVGGDVASVTGDVVVFQPSFYLKGSASAGEIEVHRDSTNGCPAAEIEPDSRVIAVLQEGANGLDWPGPTQLFTLREGMATSDATPPAELRETELINQIRGETGQYAVPPSLDEEAASIEWLTTVVPLVVALLIVLGIGLYLMRIWHRIDPS